jgi:predicted DNA binding protein
LIRKIAVLKHSFSKLILSLTCASLATFSHAKWDEEKISDGKGEEPKTYYFKVNAQGHKLILDRYMQRLIFVQKDKTFKRDIRDLKINGVSVDVYAEQFNNYPEQTAILFVRRMEALEKLSQANRIDVHVFYYREGEKVSTFIINDNNQNSKKSVNK